MKLEATEGVFGPTIQGEGMNIGMPVSFVRFYGCDFRCSWCDTPFALGKDKGGTFIEITGEEIVDQLDAIDCPNVVLSGGNPLIQPRKEFELFVELLRDKGYYVQVETQGSVRPVGTVFYNVDCWSLSPKLPSAGKMESENWKAVNWFLENIVDTSATIQLKFVVSNDEDYNYIKQRLSTDIVVKRFLTPIILQPEGLQLETFDFTNYRSSLNHLCDLVNSDTSFWADYKTIRVLPQLHKVIWGVERKR